MKYCNRCGKHYTDTNINFCLNDGELLSDFENDGPKTIFSDQLPPDDDSPPTVMMDQTRVTSPQSWPIDQQPHGYGNSPVVMPNQGFGAPSYVQSKDQTLPIIALVLGILSIPMMCCYGGIWLGIPAMVIGFLGMRNADKDPERYEGKGLAIGGLVAGGISFLMVLGMFVFFIISAVVN